MTRWLAAAAATLLVSAAVAPPAAGAPVARPASVAPAGPPAVDLAAPPAFELAAPPVFDLAAAVSSAGPGSTVRVPAGIHAGPVVIDRPLVLVGEPGAIVDGAGHGTVISIEAEDVTVRGLTIRASGSSLDAEDAGIVAAAPRATIEGNVVEDALFGIYLKSAPDSTLASNVVRGKLLDQARMGDGIKVWHSDRTMIDGNRVELSRDVIVWFSHGVTTRRNVVEDGRYGLHVMQSNDQVIEENVLRRNSVGIYLMYGDRLVLRRNLMYDHRGPSGYGLGIKDVIALDAEGNRLVANRAGIYLDNQLVGRTVDLTFRRNLLAYNEIGIEFLPSVSGATFVDNAFVDNADQATIQGSGELGDNRWSVDGRGNYWSDYAGFDVAGDGVGDVPYVSSGLYEDLMATHPELRLFQMGPAAEALDFAARAFPVFQPRRRLTDDAPLVAPPDLPPVPGLPAGDRIGHLLVALGLLAVAGAVLAAGTRPSASRRLGAAARLGAGRSAA